MSPNDLQRLIVEAASRESGREIAFYGGDAGEELPDLELSLEDHKLQYEIDSLKQELREARDTHEARIMYIGRTFWLVVAWLACVVASVTFAGFRFCEFSLSDNVLIAFITSTTVNVLGLFVLVAKWLYPTTNGSAKKVNLAKKTPKG